MNSNCLTVKLCKKVIRYFKTILAPHARGGPRYLVPQVISYNEVIYNVDMCLPSSTSSVLPNLISAKSSEVQALNDFDFSIMSIIMAQFVGNSWKPEVLAHSNPKYRALLWPLLHLYWKTVFIKVGGV